MTVKSSAAAEHSAVSPRNSRGPVLTWKLGLGVLGVIAAVVAAGVSMGWLHNPIDQILSQLPQLPGLPR